MVKNAMVQQIPVSVLVVVVHTIIGPSNAVDVYFIVVIHFMDLQSGFWR